ncbi:MAG: hypothetical protein U0794_04395 [Isosphaeraceae bacterium]
MTLRQKTLVMGALAGAVGAGLSVGATVWLGPTVGGAVGVAAALGLGAIAALAVLFAIEDRLREHLETVTSNDPSVLSLRRPIGLPDLDALLDNVHTALRRASESAADTDEVGRMARSLWASVHGKNGPMPESQLCVSGLFDLFRQTAESLRRYAASLEEANERMAHGAPTRPKPSRRTTTTVEALSDKIDQILAKRRERDRRL